MRHSLALGLLLALACLAVAFARPAAAQTGQWYAADQYYDPQAMADAKRALQQDSGAQKTFFLNADRLEYQRLGGADSFVWDTEAWYGGDFNKLWLKSEGDYAYEDGKFDEADLQILYGRAIAPYFDLQAGVRQNLQTGPGKTYGVIGIQGLAPQWFDVSASAFIGDAGDLEARLEAEYDLFLTQRLVLQPRAELNLAARDVPELGIGAGLSTAEAGLRLRYEFSREFAPYIGVSWSRKFGDTADFARTEGGDTGGASFVAGLKLWY